MSHTDGARPSVLIAAHNEEPVLGRCLDALLAGPAPLPEIIVIANGCDDNTADLARSRPGVTVIELETGSKPLALNAGECLAPAGPRIYLDADILVPAGAVRTLLDVLQSTGALAAVPGRIVDTAGRPWLVRVYLAVHQQHPAFRDGLFGRGMIALSGAGRARFTRFPEMVADDLFLDSLFSADEKAHTDAFAVTVAAPFTTKQLLHRLVRVRRGNAAMRRAGRDGVVAAEVRPPNRAVWLKNAVLEEPRLAVPAMVYLAISVVAAIRARKGPLNDMSWGQDRSTRL